jgi:predicted alpha/beta-hydrolase family hydrolase
VDPNGVRGLLLTPGASASRDQSALVAIDRAVSALGVRVARVDFPYKAQGRRRPDAAPVLIETVVVEAENLAAQAGVPTAALALGGRSMGGRICSLAVAGGLVAKALVLVSYPLHPPGRPDRLRLEHFGAIAVPCLFVSGTRDAFATPAELEAATAAIAGPVTINWIEGGDHSLRGKDAQVASVVAQWLGGQR